jgi:hypothetical protein
MVAVGAIVTLAGVAGYFLLRPRPPEAFPLSELVPADAVLYLGFPDYRELDRIPTPWSEEIRRRIDACKVHLAGPMAVYFDKSFQWVALARLTRASAALAGAEVVNGAAVAAQTPEALERHKAREGALADLAEFKALGSRFFFNVERLKLRGRLRDFSAVGFDLQSVSPFVLKGRAIYRGGLFRTYLEQYVHAPLHGEAEGSAPARAALTEHFPRIWDEVTHDLLDAIDREKAERESQILSRDYLDGRPFRDFLNNLGPGCGVSIVPTPFSRPALVAWIDLADDKTKDLLRKMIHRAVNDGARVRRERNAPPSIELADEGSVTRVKLAGIAALRLGEGFTPAYTFDGKRFIFSTCDSVLTAPSVATGDAHAAVGLQVGPLLDAVRSLATYFADEEFRSEAERKAMALYLRTFTPGTLAALRKQYPHEADLAKYQDSQKAQFTARALEDISKTPRYAEELTRVRASIEIWADRVGWIERASWSGRFTSEGLDFELRAWPAPAPK